MIKFLERLTLAHDLHPNALILTMWKMKNKVRTVLGNAAFRSRRLYLLGRLVA